MNTIIDAETIKALKEERCQYCRSSRDTKVFNPVKRLQINKVRNLCDVCVNEHKKIVGELSVEELFLIRVALIK